MSREEAMRRHPSYQSRINWLISEARREQADDVASRMLVDADAFMGGVPESVEVAQHRMDLEAVMLANSRHKRSRVPDWLGGLLLGLWIYAVVVGVGIAAGMAAGWTL